MTREEFSRNARLAAYKARAAGFDNVAEALNRIANMSSEDSGHLSGTAVQYRAGEPAETVAHTKDTL